MVATNATIPIRDLMPELFLRTIMDRVRADKGRAPQMPNLSDIIASERYTSKYWPYIEQLALETNPEQYRERMAYLCEQARNKVA